jgi:hypothetical protein
MLSISFLFCACFASSWMAACTPKPLTTQVAHTDSDCFTECIYSASLCIIQIRTKHTLRHPLVLYTKQFNTWRWYAH